MANRNSKLSPQDAFGSAVAVTKSDTTDLGVTKGIFVGGAGNLTVTMADGGTVVTFTALAVGVVHPLAVQKVMAATTATAVVALY